MDISKLESNIEFLSEQVHIAWMEEKQKQGFHSPMYHNGDGKFNPTCDKFFKVCDHCHSDLYVYNELPENIKEYDRVTVRTVLAAIRQMELQETEGI